MKNEWKQSGKVKYERTYVFAVSPIMVRFCNNFETKKNLYFILCSWQIIGDKKKDGFPSQSSSKEDQRAPTKKKKTRGEKTQETKLQCQSTAIMEKSEMYFSYSGPFVLPSIYTLSWKKSVRTLCTRENETEERKERVWKKQTPRASY